MMFLLYWIGWTLAILIQSGKISVEITRFTKWARIGKKTSIFYLKAQIETDPVPFLWEISDNGANFIGCNFVKSKKVQ